MKRRVHLDGELADIYGKEILVSANSFAEVFRCLEANYPKIRQYFLDCHEKGIGFLCEVAEKPLTDEKELLLLYPEGDMYISPQPAGAKSGGAKILAAIAIVVITVALVVSGNPGAASIPEAFAALEGAAAYAALGAITLAVNLALTGIMQIMAPDPATESGEQDESYLFQGSGQTILEGDPVPILYGQLRVPGRIVSLRIKNQNQRFYNKTAGSTYYDATNPQTSVGTSVPSTGTQSQGNINSNYNITIGIGG